MTSLRYSNDKTDKKDFVRSLIKTIPFAGFALFVLCTYFVAPVLSLVTSRAFKSPAGPKDIISFFGESLFVGLSQMQFGMVCCGLIISIVLFSFMFSKKSVNVYYSMGITRTRLYVNRVLAGVLAIFLAVIIPLTITLILNISAFGMSAHIKDVFFYEFLVLFTCGLAGLGIGSFASTVSGSMIEAVVTSGSISLIPVFLSSSVSDVNYYLLRGFSTNAMSDWSMSNFSNIFSPFTFVVDLDLVRCDRSSNYLPTERLAAVLQGTTVPKEYMIDMKMWGPILLWVVASIVLLGIGLFLMNSRKAEHSNSFGKFYVSSAINGVTVYSIALMVVSETILPAYAFSDANFEPSIFYDNLTVCLLVAGIILLITFFIGELIIRRKIKAVIRTLPIFALLFAITIFGAIYISTEHFGTYNKLPATSEIESVSMNIEDSRGIFTYDVDANDNAYNTKDAEDIKLATELFKKVSDAKYDGTTTAYDYVGFIIKLKDGSVIRRSFKVFSSEVYNNYNKEVYGSNYYKVFLKSLLLDDQKEKENEIYDEWNMMYDDTYTAGKYKNVDWYYVGDTSLFNGYGLKTGEIEINPIDNPEGLCKALYNDLVKMSYDKVYNNTTRPLGCITMSAYAAYFADENHVSNWSSLQRESEFNAWNNDNYKVDKKFNVGYVSNGIYIYPEMKETIKFLKDNGYEIAPFTAKIKEVYYANEKMSLDDVCKMNFKNLLDKDKNFREYKYYYDYDNTRGAKTFWLNYSLSTIDNTPYFPYLNNAMDYESNGKYKDTYINLFNKSFDDAGVKLNKVTDQKKAESIVSKAVPFIADIRNDDGRYIYIIYDNNIIVEEYIPAANVSVLK